MIYFKYYLSPDEYESFIREIKSMLLSLQEKLTPFAFENVRGGMGIKSLSDLDILLTDCEDNNYVILLKESAENI